MSLPVSPDPSQNIESSPAASTSPFLAPPANVAVLRLSLVSAVLLMALTAWWLFRTRTQLGRDSWFLTPNAVPWYASAWLLPVGALLIFGGFAVVSAYDAFCRAKNEATKRASIRLSLVALMLLSPVWNWSLLGPGATPLANGAGNLIGVLWSDVATQYFGVAYEISDARGFSREFATAQQKPPSAALAHVATHPPGAVLFYYGCRRVLETVPALSLAFQSLAERATNESALTLAAQANEWRTIGARSAGVQSIKPLPVEAIGTALFVAVVIAAFAAATVPAIYMLATSGHQSTLNGDSDSTSTDESDWTRDRTSLRGLTAAALWALAPTVGLFAHTLDVVVACGAAWSLALAAKYFERAQWRWMSAAGVVWGLTCWLSFGALVIGPLVVLWALFQRGIGWRVLLHDIAFLSLGFLSVWLLLCVLFPMQPILIFRQAMAAHHFATLESRLSRDWLWLNFFQFWLFCGWPLIALCCWRSLFSVLHLHTAQPEAKTDSCTQLFWATIAALIAITLGGGVRGETERLWMLFLSPLCVFAAASMVPMMPRVEAAPATDKLTSRARRLEPLLCAMALLLLQSLQTLMMAASLAPLVRPI